MRIHFDRAVAGSITSENIAADVRFEVELYYRLLSEVAVKRGIQTLAVLLSDEVS